MRLPLAGAIVRVQSEPELKKQQEHEKHTVSAGTGAHVDADLDPDYEYLASIGALHMYEGEVGFVDGTVAHLPPLEDAHLVYLRQMGYEVLGSLDLKILLAIP